MSIKKTKDAKQCGIICKANFAVHQEGSRDFFINYLKKFYYVDGVAFVGCINAYVISVYT